MKPKNTIDRRFSRVFVMLAIPLTMIGSRAFAELTIANGSFEDDGTSANSESISSWFEELDDGTDVSGSTNTSAEQALWEDTNANIPATSVGSMWGHIVDKDQGIVPAIYQNIGTWNTGDETSYTLTALLGDRSNQPFAPLNIEFYSVASGDAGSGADGTTFASAFSTESLLDSDTTITLEGGVGTTTAAYSNTFDLSGLADGDQVWLRIAIDPVTDSVGNNQRHSLIDDLTIFAAATGPFQLVIAPHSGEPGNYDFSWNSQTGKVYDLVSATDLSASPSAWSVWQGYVGIAASGSGTNVLTDVPGSGDPKRFFAVIERDP